MIQGLQMEIKLFRVQKQPQRYQVNQVNLKLWLSKHIQEMDLIIWLQQEQLAHSFKEELKSSLTSLHTSLALAQQLNLERINLASAFNKLESPQD